MVTSGERERGRSNIEIRDFLKEGLLWGYLKSHCVNLSKIVKHYGI